MTQFPRLCQKDTYYQQLLWSWRDLFYIQAKNGKDKFYITINML
jgi:hypothetical protein